MTASYFAKGKVLISGEYLVLSGAKALVMPLQSGQWMHVRSLDPGESVIHWQANEYNNPWFSATIDTAAWIIAETTDQIMADRLMMVLKALHNLNGEILKPGQGYAITTNTTFKMSWGLGSSSALITNLAHWSGIDPFALLSGVSSGSGFDVAAAQADGPIVYRLQKGKPIVTPVHFLPDFRSCIWFVYLGNKKNSAESVSEFNHRASIRPWHIETINRLTNKLLNTNDLDEFTWAMGAHELLISNLLQRKTVQEELFGDFEGTVKSLGAWGGDFIMAVSGGSPNYLTEYFKKKGFTTVFSFEDMVNSNVLTMKPHESQA